MVERRRNVGASRDYEGVTDHFLLVRTRMRHSTSANVGTTAILGDFCLVGVDGVAFWAGWNGGLVEGQSARRSVWNQWRGYRHLFIFMLLGRRDDEPHFYRLFFG